MTSGAQTSVGIESVKQRLASNEKQIKIAALYDAVKYGQTGEDLLLEILSTETGDLQWTAFELLWGTTKENGKQKLRQYLPKLWKHNAKKWNDWRDRNPDLEIDMSGADLRDANLEGADLTFEI